VELNSKRLTPKQSLAFVERRGIVLESGRDASTSLAEAVAGQAIRGSWWGHPRARAIYAATRVVRASTDVLVCRLVSGKITYVHRRLWPAIVRLAAKIGARRLAAVRDEHTKTGAHRVVVTPLSRWVPPNVIAAAAKLSEIEARRILDEAWPSRPAPNRRRRRGRIATR
jgi:hypothetical protein